MSTIKKSLRINATKLGTVSDVTSLLEDLDKVYNSIYTFNFIESILLYRANNSLNNYLPSINIENYLTQFSSQINSTKDPIICNFIDKYIHKRSQLDTLLKLSEIINELNVDSVVLQDDKLTISKVNFQSPGYWEFIGSLNPLEQIREYLKDRHAREKDNLYRNRQEEENGNLAIIERKIKIINDQILIFRSLGYSDLEIRNLVKTLVDIPLSLLDKYQDNKQIEEPDE